jgi:hypothetical protein
LVQEENMGQKKSESQGIRFGIGLVVAMVVIVAGLPVVIGFGLVIGILVGVTKMGLKKW